MYQRIIFVYRGIIKPEIANSNDNNNCYTAMLSPSKEALKQADLKVEATPTATLNYYGATKLMKIVVATRRVAI